MDITEAPVTAQELADVLNSLEGTSAHPWIAGYVQVRGEKLYIDLTASDLLAARRLGVSEEQGRTASETRSQWMVVTTFDETPCLEVEHIDGRGWMPLEF